MKTIYILRHAKSDWGDPAIKDQDRSLNDRGREAAPRMGVYIRAKKYKPELVLCSTARRTVETLELVRGNLGGAAVAFEEGLYLAEVRYLLERVRKLDDAVGSVMLIGHNPGLEQLAKALSSSPTSEGDEERHKRMREKFTTCAFAVITMPFDTWRAVKAGAGELKDFMRPKDL